jgi:hypothetical protein
MSGVIHIRLVAKSEVKLGVARVRREARNANNFVAVTAEAAKPPTLQRRRQKLPTTLISWWRRKLHPSAIVSSHLVHFRKTKLFLRSVDNSKGMQVGNAVWRELTRSK